MDTKLSSAVGQIMINESTLKATQNNMVECFNILNENRAQIYKLSQSKLDVRDFEVKLADYED